MDGVGLKVKGSFEWQDDYEVEEVRWVLGTKLR
jgi:hypothetical protein